MKELEIDVLESLIEKLDGESASAYSAFLCYAALAPNERAGEIALPKLMDYTGLSENTLKQYREIHEWQERANLVDAYQFKLNFEETREMMKADRVKYVEFNRQIKDQMMENLLKTTGVISTLISYADLIGEEKKTGEFETKDGRILHQFTTVNMKAKVSDIAVLANAVTKCARAINELPTEIIENKIATNIDLNKLQSSELDDLDEVITKRMKELQANVILTDGVN